MEEPTGLPSGHRRTARLEAFSDGVFAIAATLLVLDIAVPIASAADPWPALRAEWPAYLTYFVSFATIGALWVGHSTITEYLDRANPIFVRLNLVLLLFVAFLPFPTRLLGQYVASEESERVAVTVYGISLMIASTALAILWRYGARAGLISSDLEDDDLRALTRRINPGIGGYVVLLAIGLRWPKAALVGYLVVAFFFLVPLRPSERRRRRPTPSAD